MQEFRIISEIDVNCPPEKLYEFVTTPDHWVGSHPSTKGVKGETSTPRKLGDEWIELIEAPGGTQFEARWKVVEAEEPARWKIKADSFGGLPITVTITYLISTGAASHFKRDLIFAVADSFPVSAAMREALSSRETHDLYLKRIKERIEKQTQE